MLIAISFGLATSLAAFVPPFAAGQFLVFAIQVRAVRSPAAPHTKTSSAPQRDGANDVPVLVMHALCGGLRMKVTRALHGENAAVLWEYIQFHP